MPLTLKSWSDAWTVELQQLPGKARKQLLSLLMDAAEAPLLEAAGHVCDVWTRGELDDMPGAIEDLQAAIEAAERANG